ncbi:MAG: DUF2029 domain-containing protein [Streptosporangiaceae bacterium]|nr:DUF2029 domain-containing protein [Streptosporangiaceae bacterium]
MGLAIVGLSVLCTVVVAASGASVMEPVLPGRGGQPPWAFDLHLPPYLAIGLTALGLAAGAAGLALTLRAIHEGWLVPARAILLAGLAAAVVLTLLPPFGSSDPLSYAAYGRMVVTGHNPYLTTPAQLAAHGDAVAGAVQDWFKQPSVYGPLASGIQALASLAGRTSARLTVFVLDLFNLAAFAVTALLLHRMTSGRADRQLRAALLWAANPLLLQVLVAGAHVDVQQIALCVAAVALLYGPWTGPGRPAEPTPVRALLAGVLVGLGFGIKVTAALVGLAFVIGLWLKLHANRQRLGALLASMAVGFVVTAGAAVAIGGSAMLKTTSRASDMVSIGSPWRVIRAGLQHAAGYSTASDIVKYGAIVLAVLLVILLVRGLPQVLGENPPVYVPLAFFLGWLFAWPYVLPWYDALGWAVLALVPASNVDWLVLARTVALGFAYLPARTADVTLPHGLHWIQPVFRNGVAPVVLAGVTVWLVVILLRDDYSALSDTGSVGSDRAVRGSDRRPDGGDRASAGHQGGEGVHGADRGQRRVARDG